MSISVKYFVADNNGSYIDWAQRINGYGAVGAGEVMIAGGSGNETVYLQAGTSADVRELGTGDDKIYLTGRLADYTQTIDQASGAYTLTRTTGLAAGQVEVVQFSVGADDDVLYFADGHVVLNAVSDPLIFDGTNFLPLSIASLQAGGTPATPVTNTPISLAAQPDQVYLLDPAGVTLPAQQRPGQSMKVVGTQGADSVYVTAGTHADAAELGVGDDRVYLTGKLSDYSQAIDQSTGVYTLTRTAGLPAGQSEVVRFTVGAEDDLVYFADGHIVLNASTNANIYDSANGVFLNLSYAAMVPGATPGLNPKILSAADPASDVYVGIGGTLDVSVNFSSNVVLALGKTVTLVALIDKADGTTQEVVLTATGTAASAASGGVSSLHFQAVLPAGLNDVNGIALKTDSLALGTATAAEFLGANGLAADTTFARIDLPHQLVDTVAPTIAMAHSSAGNVVNGAEAVASAGVLTVTAEAGASITVVLTGVSGAVTKTIVGTGAAQAVVLSATDVASLGEGAVSVSAAAVDAAGNTTTVNTGADFTLDTVAPAVALAHTAAGTAINATKAIDPTGVVTVTGEAGAAISVVLTGSSGSITRTFTGTGSAQVVALSAADVSTLGQGAVSVVAEGTDAAGNVVQVNAGGDFTLDSLAPHAVSVDVSGHLAGGAAKAAPLKAGDLVYVTVQFDEVVAVQGGPTVALQVNGQTRTATYVSGSGSDTLVFSYTVVAGDDTVAVGVGSVIIGAGASIVDAAGNAYAGGSVGAPASVVTIDTVAPTITLQTVAGDDRVNGEEKAAGVTVSGTTNAEPGQTVTVSWGSSTKAAIVAADGSWSVVYAGSSVPPDGAAVPVQAVVQDRAGNQSTVATRNVAIDSNGPLLTITTPLTDGAGVPGSADDILNSDELAAIPSGGSFVVRGTADVEDGQLVTLVLNNITYSAVVTGGVWSASIPRADVAALANGNVYTLDAQVRDASGNAASGSQSLTISTATPAVPTVVVLETNTPTPTIHGLAEKLRSGTYIALASGDVIEVSVGGHTYSLTLASGVSANGPLSYDSATKTWSLAVPAGVISADGVYDVSVGIKPVGKVAFTYDNSAGELVVKQAAPVIVLDPVAVDDRINAVEKSGSLTLSGTVTDNVPGSTHNAAVGQSISLTLNGKTYTTLVQADGSWSVLAPASDVAALSEGQQSLQASFGSVFGNTGTSTKALTVDSIAPQLSLAALTDTDLTAGEAAAFSMAYTTTDAGGAPVVTVAVLDAAAQPQSGLNLLTSGGAVHGDLSVLADGTYTIQVTSTDAVGNATVATRQITIDKTPPTVTITADKTALSAGVDAILTLTFSEDPGSTFSLSDLTVSGGTLGALSGSGLVRTVVFTPTAGMTSGTGSVSIAAGSYADAAGNAGAAATSPVITVDTSAPVVSTVAITSNAGADNTYAAGEVVEVTVTFDEAVTVTGAPTIALNVGGVIRTATYHSGSGTSALVFSYTVTAGDTDTNGISINANSLALAGGHIRDAATNDAVLAHTAVADDSHALVDSTGPAVLSAAVTSSGGAGDTYAAGEPISITVTFDSVTVVTGSPVLKINVGGIQRDATYVSGSNSTALVFMYTPQAGDTDSDGVSIDADSLQLNGGTIKDLYGNAATLSHPAVAADPLALVDTTPPTLQITDDVVSGAANGVVTYTFTFSENVEGFDASDVTVSHGTKGLFTRVDGKTYTLEVTPTANAEGADIGVAVGVGLTDVAGNPIAAATIGPAQAYDTLPPTVAITASKTSLNAGETALLTFVFSEVPVGFDVTDITVTGGQLSGFAVDSADPKKYTATYTPNPNALATGTVSIASGTFHDAAGNANADGSDANNTVVFAFDTQPPQLTITDDVAGVANGPVIFTFNFDEAVTGFTVGDIAVTGGTAGTLTQVNASQYTLVVTPNANSTTPIGVTVAAGSVSDLSGNALAAAVTVSQAVDTTTPPPADTTPPTLVITDDVPGTANGPVVFTFDFSEAVTGFTASDIVVSGGTAGTLTQVNASQYTLVVTPSANSTTPIGVTVAAGSVSDLAGNALAAAISVTQPVDTTTPAPVDTTAPTLVITDDVPGTANGPVVFTFDFSEAVTGFTASDIAVTGGTAGTLTQVNASQYTLVVTPSANSTTPIGVTVAAGSVSDLAGNALAAAVSVTQPVNTTTPPPADTTAPTLVITDDVAGTANGPVVFTFNFDEAVTGFTIGDITVTGGTAGALTQVNASQYTLVVTPSANSTTPIGVTVAAGSVSDLSGNALAAAVSVTQPVDTTTPPPADTTAPTLVITDDVPGTANGPVVFTFDFSEAVTGFTASDIVVTGGTAGTLTQVNASQYTLVVTPSANSTTPIGVTVAAGSVSDLAGNVLAAAVSVTQPVNTTTPPPADTTAPTLVITDDVPGTANGPVVFTFTFDEAVSGFDVSKVVLSHGTAGAFSKVNDSTYTLVVTPEANSTAAIGVTVAAGAVSDLAGNALAAAVSVTQPVNTTTPAPVDTTPPTLVITDNVPGTANGPVVFTFTFDEAVSGFDVSKVVLSHGTAGAFSKVNDSTYTLVVTPETNSTNAITVTVGAGGASDLAGNALAAAVTASQAVDTTTPAPVDTTPPTLVITDDTSGTASGAVVYTFTFSEDVTGFDASDVTVAHGTKGALTMVNAHTYTLVVTPPAGAEGADLGVSVGTGVTDLAGNAIAAVTTAPAQAYDTKAPTVAVTADKTALKAGESALLTFTFSEPPVGFDLSDVIVTGGSLSGFAVDAADPKKYTAIFTPLANAELSASVSIGSGAFNDAVGNANVDGSDADNHLSIAVDTLAPTLIITDDATGTTNSEVIYTFTFSENVTGFDASDVTVAHGVKGSFTVIDGKTYTLAVTPAAGDQGPDLGVSVGTGVKDAAGNAIAAVTYAAAQAYDTLAPTVAISTDKPALKAGEVALLTFTFSEVPVGFDITGITVVGGQLSGLAVDPSDPKKYTATFTPTTNTEASASVSIASGTFSDDVGNDNTDGSDANNTVVIAVDTKAPTATITLSDAALNAGETSTVTIAFSEAVTGFDNTDLTVQNGTLSAVSSTDGGKTWTATFTPLQGVEASANLIHLNAASVTDAAGNPNWAANSANYVVDTRAPTVVITDDVPGTANGPVIFTFDFSEAVTGFTASDIVVTGGTAGVLTQVNASQYTLVVTPSANSTTPIGVTVAAGSVSDLAGNVLAAAVSVTQPVDTTTPPPADTTAPTLVITDDVPGTANGPVVFTFDFSEAVTGFTASDIVVTGGTAGTLTQVNASQYTLVVTPSANSTTPIGVTVAAGSVSDLAGNALAAAVSATQPVNTTTPPPADTTAPTLVITDDVPGTANGPVVFTFDFSEAVTGFTASDIVVTGGTAGTLTQVNASQYTLVVTPSANSTTPIGVTVAAGSVSDLAGNALAAAVSVTQPVNTTTPPPADTTAPTLVITDDVAGTANGPVVFTFNFDEAVTGFTIGDITVTGGTAGALTQVNASQYTLVVTPSANSTTPIGVTVAAGSVSDLSGNALAAAVTVSQAVDTTTPPPADTTAPTLVITDDVPGTANGPVVFTFDFSEAVTGFTASDIVVTGGTAGTLTQVNASQYTLVVTPSANSTTPIGVTVAAGSVSDLAGNALAAAVTVSQPVNTTTPPPADTTAPTLVITDDVPGTANGPVMFTFTFDEAVSGFDVSKVVLSHGTAGAFSKVNDSTYTLVVTPEANSTAAIGVTVAAGSVSDLAGNALAAAVSVTQPVNTTTPPPADTTAPTLVITDNVPGTANGPVVFTFTFDEAVSGFDVSKVVLSHGTAGAFSKVNDSTYTLVVTPEANSTNAITVTVGAGGASDLAGNALAAAVTASQAVDTTTPAPVDTTAPTLVITDDTSGTASGAVVYTFTFSEDVTGFDASDVTVAHGTKGALTMVNAHTYTLVVTPPAGAEGADLGVSVGTGVTDLAGNAMAAVTTAPAQDYDTKAPTLATTTYAAPENQTAVATLAGTDAHAITYSLVGGADASLFNLSSSGVLTFKTAPDFEAPGSSAASNTYALTVRMTDALGNSADQAIAVGVTDVPEAPVLTATQNLDDVTNLDVRSALVLTFDQSSLSLGSGQIRIMDDMGTNGWTVRNTTTGESKQDVSDNDVVITLTNGAITGLTVGGVDRSAYMAGAVTISGNKLIINPSDRDTVNDATWNFDWDFGANYHVELDAGVVTGAGGVGNAAMTDSTRLNFKTVTPADAASGAVSQKMNVADGSIGAGTIWHNGHVQDDSMGGLALDFSTGSHAVYVQSDGANSRTTTIAGKVLVSGFGSDDLIYMDNLGSVSMPTTEGQIGGIWGASGNDISRYLNNSDGGLNERVVFVNYLLTGTGVNNIGGDKIFESSAHANANVIVFG